MNLVGILICFLLVLFNSSCSNYEDPYDAYNQGDYATAKTQLSILAKQGDAKALTHLGVMYQLGLGVKKDMSKAVSYYEIAADKGYAPGQYNMGLLLYEGKAVKQDYKKAYEMFEKAARQGHSKAKNRAEDMLVDVKLHTILKFNSVRH